MNKITDLDINTLPGSIRSYENIKELAETIIYFMNGCAENIVYDSIWARIDKLPEALIDVLAYDLHIDWYDYGYTLKQKREVLKTSIAVHKKLGTKYAVETALKAAYPNSSVTAWYEEGGSGVPYTFDVVLDTSESDRAVDFLQVNRIVYYYKSLRDRVSATKFKLRTKTLCAAACFLMPRIKQNIAPAADTTGIRVSVKAYSAEVFKVRRRFLVRCEAIIPVPPTPIPGGDIAGVLRFGGMIDEGVIGEVVS